MNTMVAFAGSATSGSLDLAILPAWTGRAAASITTATNTARNDFIGTPVCRCNKNAPARPRGRMKPDRYRSGGLACGELAQHVMQDSAVAEIFDFLRRQQQRLHREAQLAAVRARRDHGDLARGAVLQADDVDRLI